MQTIPSLEPSGLKCFSRQVNEHMSKGKSNHRRLSRGTQVAQSDSWFWLWWWDRAPRWALHPAWSLLGILPLSLHLSL